MVVQRLVVSEDVEGPDAEGERRIEAFHQRHRLQHHPPLLRLRLHGLVYPEHHLPPWPADGDGEHPDARVAVTRTPTSLLAMPLNSTRKSAPPPSRGRGRSK